MEKIRITDRMAEALTVSVTVGDHREIPIGIGQAGSIATRHGLESRGLVEYRTSGKNRVTVLTARGEAVRASLVQVESRRSWPVDLLDAAARGLSRKPCASTNPTTPTTAKCKSCGLRVADGSEYHESCRPATPKTMPGTIEPATTTLGKPVTDFQVKVWYASGSSETISHIDFMAAASIYGEAEDNPRAIAAEVHCPGGCLAASFTRQPVDTAGERG